MRLLAALSSVALALTACGPSEPEVDPVPLENPPVCEAVPESLDFGAVEVGEVGRVSLTLSSPLDAAQPASIEPANGPFSLLPGTDREIVIEFRPTTGEAHAGQLKLRTSAQCPEKSVTLVGVGVESGLTWDPTGLDFGYVTPGVEVSRDITFRNSGLKDVELSRIKSNNPAELYVLGGVTELTVPAASPGPEGQWTAGSATLTVVFQPQAVGVRSTQIQFDTSLAAQPHGLITFKGYGGGPAIQVTPSPELNFGKVAFFDGTPTPQKRKLTVINVGTLPPSPDVTANLHIHEVAVVELAGTESGTFAANLVNYDDRAGIQAKAGVNSSILEVTISPQSIGLKRATLRIATNDPAIPVVEVLLSADVLALPSCQYTVTPTTLSFGMIPPGESRDLSFHITNTGTAPDDICVISGMDFAAGSDPSFMMVSAPITSRELNPGQSTTVVVRAESFGQPPFTPITLAGTVEFFVSSSTDPRAQVSLIAQLSPP